MRSGDPVIGKSGDRKGGSPLINTDDTDQESVIEKGKGSRGDAESSCDQKVGTG